MLARLLIGVGLVGALAVRTVGAAPWTSLGPDGGDIRRIVVDPQTPTILYASTDRSLFKSTDAGATWTALPLSGLAYRIAIDPLAPSTLYAGIVPAATPAVSGLYKSTDGGASFVRLAAAPSTVRSLATDPTTPGRVYVGEYGKVWRSLDGGATWKATTLAGGLSVEAMAVDPVNAGVLYVSTFEVGSSGDLVYKSVNGGVNFSTTPLVAQDVASLAVDPVDPQVVYAGPFAFTGTKLWKSVNGGNTWSPSDTGLSFPLNVYEAPIVVDPVTHTTVYVGTLTGVFKSVDAGATWTPASTGLVSPRVNALAIHPTAPATLWVGTFEGELAKSTDGAVTWTSSARGIREDSVVTVAVDPANAAVLYTGSDYNGVHKSVDGGTTWAAANAGLSSGRMRFLQVDPAAPATVYALSGDFPASVARSLDGATTWSESTAGLPVDPDLELTALALDPTVPGQLFLGTNADDLSPGAPSLFRSVDGGVTWSATTAVVSVQVDAIAVAPSSGRIYVGDDDSQVQVSDDGGTVWTAATPVPGFVTAFAVHPTDPMTVLAGTQQGVRRSIDGGTTWLSTNLPSRTVAAIAFDPTAPANAYAAATSGVFASLDGGDTWTEVSSGLPVVDAAALAVDPTTAARVYLGVFGGSVYRRDLATCTSDADCDDVSVCTTGDACLPTDSASNAFGCVHTPVVCPAPNECQTGAGTCDRFAGCQYPRKPDNTACTDDGTACTSDLCEGGACLHAAAPRAACHAPTLAEASVLSFRNVTPAKARLSWRWTKGAASAADVGNPLTAGASDYEVCVYDAGGVGGSDRFVAGMKAPAGGTCAGRSCWLQGGHGVKYKDRDQTPDGLDTLQLRIGAVDQASIRAMAKGPHLQLPAAPLAPRVRVQLRRDDSTSACWEALFLSHVEKNLAGNFKARSE